jgi:hypothetical protein
MHQAELDSIRETRASCPVIRITEDNGPVSQHLPSSGALRENFIFDFTGTREECDFWFVRGNLPSTETCRCPPQNIFLLCAEPPGVKLFYSPAFLNQFAEVYGTNPFLRHHSAHLTHPHLAWRVGLDFSRKQAVIRCFDYVKDSANISKEKTLSTVTSSKRVTRGHRLRRDLIEYLETDLADAVDFAVFGDGINPVTDKWDALAPYKYHLAIENSRASHYFSEKLMDAFLTECLPFYYGCPDFGDYFPAEAAIEIDIGRPKDVAAQIREAVATGQWEKRLPAIREAKRRVLYDYNILMAAAGIARRHVIGPKQSITLHPEAEFLGFTGTLAVKAANRLYARFAP